MPTYSYSCNKCSKEFEIFCSIKDYTGKSVCSCCRSRDTKRRYITDVRTIATSVKKSDSELKTLGDLAQRNSDRMSTDEKIALSKKHTAHNDTELEKELPKGMSRMKKTERPAWPGGGKKQRRKLNE